MPCRCSVRFQKLHFAPGGEKTKQTHEPSDKAKSPLCSYEMVFRANSDTYGNKSIKVETTST